MESNSIIGEDNNVFYMSWLAYIKPVVGFLILLSISVGALLVKYNANLPPQSFLLNPLVTIISVSVMVLNFLLFILNIYYLRTVCLYFNDSGVYLFRGVFPWTKGTSGTLWRDISDANYNTGFISWITKAYNVRIGHRQTKSTEIFVPCINRGNEAVIAINEILKDKASKQS